MIMMDAYCIMGIVVFVFLNRRWRVLSTIAKWQLLCLVYPWSIVLVLCFGGSFPQRLFGFEWVWFTIANHLVFVGLCAWAYRNRQIFAPFLSLKTTPPEDDRIFLFQVSEVLLAS